MEKHTNCFHGLRKLKMSVLPKLSYKRRIAVKIPARFFFVDIERVIQNVYEKAGKAILKKNSGGRVIPALTRN